MGLLAALQFLTRVPIRLRREPSLSKSVAWFPVAGAIIGAAVGGAAAGLWFVVPPTVAAACAVTVGLLITGAFHEDGLADVADGFGGGNTREERLEIMKDSRIGAFGTLTLILTVAARASLLAALLVVVVGGALWLHVSTRGAFLTPGNLSNVLRQNAFIAILGAGMTFVILTGGIDLSVGSVVGLSGVVCADLLTRGVGIAPAAAWIAVEGSLDLRILWLTAAVTFWTAGFDMIYSCQDYEFDRGSGLHSVPKRLGIAGALAAMVDTVMVQAHGKDLGETMIAAVFGDESADPGRNVRHSRWRARSDVPAPRK